MLVLCCWPMCCKNGFYRNMSDRCFDPFVGRWSLVVGLWFGALVGDGLWSSVFGPLCATTIVLNQQVLVEQISVVVLIQFGRWSLVIAGRWSKALAIVGLVFVHVLRKTILLTNVRSLFRSMCRSVVFNCWSLVKNHGRCWSLVFGVWPTLRDTNFCGNCCCGKTFRSLV